MRQARRHALLKHRRGALGRVRGVANQWHHGRAEERKVLAEQHAVKEQAGVAPGLRGHERDVGRIRRAVSRVVVVVVQRAGRVASGDEAEQQVAGLREPCRRPGRRLLKHLHLLGAARFVHAHKLGDPEVAKDLARQQVRIRVLQPQRLKDRFVGLLARALGDQTEAPLRALGYRRNDRRELDVSGR